MEHKTRTKVLSWLLSLALTLGLLPALSSSALADEVETTYTLTIPSTLTVANSGWNATDGISATGTLASGKKLTVTASSANSFKLKSGNNEVGYKLATASTDTEATTSWTFDSLSDTATKKDMGIIVEDYSEKPAGTYTDTVTFTAKVEDAATVLAPALENDATVVIAYRWNGYNTTTFTFTNNGGTYSCNVGGDEASDFSGSLTLNGTTLALSITNSIMSDINLAINFDTTNDTYSFVTKGSWYSSHTVSVNGTDITDQLTEKN